MYGGRETASRVVREGKREGGMGGEKRKDVPFQTMPSVTHLSGPDPTLNSKSARSSHNPITFPKAHP